MLLIQYPNDMLQALSTQGVTLNVNKPMGMLSLKDNIL